jgi:hypothetical protein
VFILPAVDCRVIEKPVNIVAVAGTTVNFNCASNQTGVIRWASYALGSKDRTQVWNGLSALSPYLVNETQCKHDKNCNLTVKDITLKSAGSYACRDAMFSADEFLATLTVLGEESFILLPAKLEANDCLLLPFDGKGAHLDRMTPNQGQYRTKKCCHTQY